MLSNLFPGFLYYSCFQGKWNRKNVPNKRVPILLTNNALENKNKNISFIMKFLPNFNSQSSILHNYLKESVYFFSILFIMN